MFTTEELSQTDAADYLVREHICEEQDDASIVISSAWSVLEKRLSCMGPYTPIAFRNRMMIRQVDWKDVPAHSYCLVVSLGPRYQGWRDYFGSDYSAQGRLFELITRAAMEVTFCNWLFFETGWRRDNTSN